MTQVVELFGGPLDGLEVVVNSLPEGIAIPYKRPNGQTVELVYVSDEWCRYSFRSYLLPGEVNNAALG